jgi:hypothetical protein
VVAAQQDGNTTDELVFDGPLAEWICGGGKAILSDFRGASATAADTLACAGARFDGVTNYAAITSTGSLFAGTEGLTNPGWGIYASGLETTEEVYATDGVTRESVHDEAASAIGGDVTATGTSTFRELWAVEPARALYAPTWALEIAWDGAATTTWTLPGSDATPWKALSLRLLAIHDDPLNPPGGGLDFTVVLTDAGGASASLPLSAAPGGALGATPDWLEGTVPKSVFETRRLSLAAFAAAAPELDLARLVSVALVFDRAASGRILIDDLALASGGGCP